MSYIYSRNQPLSQPQSTLPARGRPTSGSGRGPPLSAYSSIGHLGGSPSNASPSGRRSQPSDFWNMQRNNQHHSSTRLIKRPAGEFPVHIYHFHDVRCSHTSQPTHDRQLRATDYSIYRVPTAGRAQPAADPLLLFLRLRSAELASVGLGGWTARECATRQEPGGSACTPCCLSH